MGHGRTRGPGWSIERERQLLGGDVGGEGCGELGHRRPGERPTEVATVAMSAGAAQSPSSHVRTPAAALSTGHCSSAPRASMSVASVLRHPT